MRESYQENKAAQLRHSAVWVIGKVLRGEYETIMPTDIPPEHRGLIEKIDQRQRTGEATAAQKRK